MVNDKVVQLRVQVISDTRQLEVLRKGIAKIKNTELPIFQKRSEAIAIQQQKLFESTKKLNSVLNPREPPFQGWALSILFAGLALQRFATQIRQFGTKAYDEIMHSIDGAVTSNEKFTGSMTMLAFSIGEALDPLYDALIPIIDSITDFVDKNPGFVRSIVELATILGTGGMLYGGLVLAKGGFDGLIKSINNIPSSASALKSYDWKGLGNSISTGIGVVSITYAFVQAANAFSDFSDGKFVDGLLNALSAGFAAVGGLKLVKGQKGGAALIAIGVALDLVEQNTFFTTFTSIIGALVATVAGSLAVIGVLIERAINKIISEIPSPIRKLLGINSMSSKNLDPVKAFEDAFTTQMSGWLSLGINADSYLGGLKAKAQERTVTAPRPVEQSGNTFTNCTFNVSSMESEQLKNIFGKKYGIGANN